MIRPLRQRHRHIFAFLAVTLPVAFAIGVVARKPVPVADSLPGEVAPEHRSFATTRRSRHDVFLKTHIQVNLMSHQSKPDRLAFALSAPKDFVKPDLLVYFVPGDSQTAESIPDNAMLLGGFNDSAALPLPQLISASKGVLVLYSLADHEIVDVSQPINFATP